MRKRTRRIIFYLSFVVFLGLSYITLLYAQGYRYNFTNGQFSRTGAISLTVNTSAKVFIDDELAGETSFLTNAFGYDRLLPGRYSIRVQRDGYSNWQKTVTVEEGRVIDFPDVLILPQGEEELAPIASEIYDIFKSSQITLNPAVTPRPKVSPSPTPLPEIGTFILKTGTLIRIGQNQISENITTRVAGFSVSQSERQILWWTQNELWVMWLEDADNRQPFHQAGDKELITRFSSPIKKAGWFRGDSHVVVESNGLKIVEVDKRGGINIIKI